MEIHEQVLVELRRIVRALDLQSKQLQKVGLTGSQLLVLRALDQRGALTSHQLSEAVSLSQGTVTTVLDRLELKGLIKRERSPQDKRRLVITLTPAGQQALSQAPSLLHVDFLDAFKRLDSWEQTLILSSLQRVAAMMDTAKTPPRPRSEPGGVAKDVRLLAEDAEEAGC